MPSERRHLTILNCDIVNSTQYADSMDPEDFESLLTIFYETSKSVVEEAIAASLPITPATVSPPISVLPSRLAATHRRRSPARAP